MPLGSFRLNGLSKFLSLAAPPAFGSFGLWQVLDNPNVYSTSAVDRFGNVVSISNNYAIVGAYGEDDASGSTSGSAYVYNLSTGSLLYTLVNPNASGTSQNDQFGSSVAISDSYAIVGAPTEDVNASNSGSAYVYNLSTGSLLYTLNNPNAYGTGENDYFGYSVSISNNYAIVGAYSEDDASGVDSGKAYVYNLSTGSLLYTLNNPNAYGTGVTDYFGYSVSISNNYAIVGAYGESFSGGDGGASGKAYIFDLSDGSLKYTLQNVNAYNTPVGDYFGFSVAISNNYAIVGAPFEDDAGGSSSGKAYIYSLSTGSLLYVLHNPNAYGSSSGDFFGYTVSISNTHAIVGAYGEAELSGPGSGRAYIFDLSDGSLAYTLNNPNAYGTVINDSFGISVSISNNYAIVGAAQEDDAGGITSSKAYLYSTIENDHISMPTPIGVERISTNSFTTANATIPGATTQVGDLLVLFDFSTTVTDITPSDWTSISKASTTGIRTNISYKLANSGDIGATITGMSGTTRKILMVFRNYAGPLSSVSLSSPSQQATTAAPTNQTISGGTKPTIYFACYGSTGSSVSYTYSGLPTGYAATVTNNVSTSGISVRYFILNPGANSFNFTASIGMTDGGTNTLQSFRIDL